MLYELNAPQCSVKEQSYCDIEKLSLMQLLAGIESFPSKTAWDASVFGPYWLCSQNHEWHLLETRMISAVFPWVNMMASVSLLATTLASVVSTVLFPGATLLAVISSAGSPRYQSYCCTLKIINTVLLLKYFAIFYIQLPKYMVILIFIPAHAKISQQLK